MEKIEYTPNFVFSENDRKVIDCIKENIIIGTKDIILKTQIADRTVRRILKKLVDNKVVEIVGNAEKAPNKKYKMAE